MYIMSHEPSVNDISGLSDFLFGFKSHVHESLHSIDVSVMGDISSNNGRRAKVLQDAYKKMMPPTHVFNHLIEAKEGDFSFQNFALGLGLSFFDLNGSHDDNGGFSRVVIDETGKFLG